MLAFLYDVLSEFVMDYQQRMEKKLSYILMNFSLQSDVEYLARDYFQNN